MQFADPQELSTAYLILRHLYDGDVIEWPIAENHALHSVFTALESQGYVARWDRMWPRRDRYRLTEKGIATIEAVYRPAGAELVFEELRRRTPAGRAPTCNRSVRSTPWSLHDPSTHWDSYRDEGGATLTTSGKTAAGEAQGVARVNARTPAMSTTRSTTTTGSSRPCVSRRLDRGASVVDVDVAA
jgi:DNA-binding PadR family transcriptional regulator